MDRHPLETAGTRRFRRGSDAPLGRPAAAPTRSAVALPRIESLRTPLEIGPPWNPSASAVAAGHP
jgi:hypothetical protein